jgi:hypothetical protein
MRATIAGTAGKSIAISSSNATDSASGRERCLAGDPGFIPRGLLDGSGTRQATIRPGVLTRIEVGPSPNGERAMSEGKDCPLCGERMRLVPRTITDRIPGQSQTSTREVREWICPDCDYFEEQELEDWERPAPR